MTEPKRQTRAEMLAENAQRLARAAGDLIEDVRAGVPEDTLMVTLDFMSSLLRQRRQIKAHANYREACDNDLSGISAKQD